LAHVRSLIATTIATALLMSVVFVATFRADRAYANAVGQCQETQLDVKWVPDGAGLGHVADLIVVTNISADTCTLSGYPSVKMTGAAKTASVVVARKTQNGYLGGLGGTGAALALPVVKLRAHGGIASSMVEGDDTPPGNAVTCLLFTKVSVAIPRLSPTYRLTIKFPGCVRPEVHPIVKGTSGTSVK
jgi:hypothetical protein